MNQIIGSIVWLTNAKDIVQIAFYIIIAIITILTFIRANKTLLQPIKTEIFKEQMKALSKAIELFGGKYEPELTDDFGFEEIIYVNCHRMLNDYSTEFFGQNISLPPIESLQRFRLYEIPPHVTIQSFDKYESERKKYDEDSKEYCWLSMTFGDLLVPVKFYEAKKTLQMLESNPFLTKELRNHIGEYLHRVHSNLILFRNILHKNAMEMTSAYQTFEDFKKGNPMSIYQISRMQFCPSNDYKFLKEKANEIAKYINEYIKADNLLKG